MVTNYPLRNPQIVVEDMGDEAVLATPNGSAIHALNATAFFVWGRCDGEHSPEQITAALRAEFQVPESVDVSADVNTLLAEFASKKLLI
jgi:hypothetical protein